MDFPHNNWYLNFTEEERPIVDNWRINIIKFSKIPCSGNFINYRGAGWLAVRGTAVLLVVLITFDQFKTHVLNIETSTENQDYSYLLPILNKLKIK
jgi:hypothetical protein